MTIHTLTEIYRTASDSVQVVALMAESGDPEAAELVQYLHWANNAVGQTLKRKLVAAKLAV